MTLFTVEQLELIRRLRSTGITADAVVEAFGTLENVQSTLNASRAQSSAIAALIAPSRLLNVTSDHPSVNSEVEGIHSTSTLALFQTSKLVPKRSPTTTSPIVGGHSAPAMPPATTLSSHILTTSPFLRDFLAGGMSLTTPLTAVSSRSCSNLSAAPRTGPIRPSKSAQSSPPSMMSASSNRPIRSQRTPMKEITTLDDPSELDDFLAQGEEACIVDMKAFITQHSLRQTTVATMTGVSQPYISKLLNGNHRELSLRCRKNIYCWYLNCRRHPEKLASFLQDTASSMSISPDGELMVPQRRERYVFRPVLIKILDRYFRDAPFPDCAKRAEIAVACNRALQTEKKDSEPITEMRMKCMKMTQFGCQLMAKEVVTPQVVANWFANKRKEMRRRSNGRDNSPNVNVAFAGDCMESISDCGSTPSPPENASGITTLSAAGEERCAAEDFLHARPFAHMRKTFTSGNTDDVMPTAFSPNTTNPSSLFDLLNMPAYSSPTTPTTTSVPSPIATSLAPSCEDLLNRIVQNGVLNFANSAYLDECALQTSKTIHFPV